MQIDWPRYVKTAKEQGLTGIEVVRLIQKETNRKVNISEVKRRLAGTESSTLGFEADTVDVIDLIEEDLPQETTLRFLRMPTTESSGLDVRNSKVMPFALTRSVVS